MPSIRDAIVQRPRLERRLDDAFGKRLTVVVAGAGYGKSTLVGRWADDVMCAWHTITLRDTSLSSVHRGVSRALAPVVTNFPADLAVAPTAATRSDADERSRAETLAGRLAQTLAGLLDHDLVLVIDDAHLLPVGTPSARFLEALCRQAPDTLHLVLLSRNEAPFAIERLRSRNQVLELAAEDLAFDAGEVQTLMRTALGQPATVHAPEVYAITSGWPAAVRMVVERLRHVASDEWQGAVDAMRQPGGALFAYLADEVFGREPKDIRDLLVYASELQRLNAPLATAIGLVDAEATLSRLARRGLLFDVAEVGEEWFTLHELVRAFCREEWALGDTDRRDLHVRAAEWFSRQKLYPEALRSLRIAANPDAIATFLRERGRETLPGTAEELIDLADALPSSFQDADVALCLGEANVAAGRLDDARQHLMQAAGGKDELDPHLARMLGLTYYSDGDLGEAVQLISKARIDGSRPRDEALLLALWANIESLRGEIDRARELAEQSQSLATAAGDAQARAHAYHALGLASQLAGDGRSFVEYYRQATRWADRAGDTVLAGRSRVNLVAELIADGRIAEALDDVAAVIEDAEVAGEGANRLPMLLTVRGNALSAVGQFEEAIASYTAVARSLERQGSQFGAGHLVGLGDAYRERGDLPLARAAYERCIALADALHNVVHLSPALTGLARTQMEDDPDGARELARRSAEANTGMFDVDAALGSGWVALAQGDRDTALAAAEEAEQTARKRGHRAELAECLELRAVCATDPAQTAALLADAAVVWKELGNDYRAARAELARTRIGEGDDGEATARRAERRLREAGVRIEAAGRAAGLLAFLPPARVAPVAIETLGGFRLMRDGKVVPVSEWQSKKARDLLKLLVTRRGRPVPRDALMESLWPGDDPAKLSNRLSVSFLTEAGAGLGGDLERLEDAEAVYAGDFLEEDAYDDWAIPLREEARATYVQVARTLAESSFERGDVEVGARYLRRILERDPYDERAHLGLVEWLGRAGQHGQARRAYGAYIARMDDVGVEPAPFPTRS